MASSTTQLVTQQQQQQPPSPPAPFPLFKARKGLKSHKHRDPHHQPPFPPRPSDEPEITLDTNLDEMDGIIDPTHVQANGPGNPQQPLTRGDASFHSLSDNGSMLRDDSPHHHSSSFGTSEGLASPSHHLTSFTDPWRSIPAASIAPTLASTLRTPPYLLDSAPITTKRPKVPAPLTFDGQSPKGMHTLQEPSGPPGLPGGSRPPPAGTVNGNSAMDKEKDPSKDPAWYAPESWDVDKAGPVAEYSSDEEETTVQETDALGEMGVLPGIRTRNTSVATSSAGRYRAKLEVNTRKDSWPEEHVVSRRPSEATSTTTVPRTPSPSVRLLTIFITSILFSPFSTNFAFIARMELGMLCLVL